MPKIGFHLIYSVFLQVVEFLFLVVFLALHNFLFEGIFLADAEYAFSDSYEISIIKYILCATFFLILFPLLFYKYKVKRKVINVALLNVGIYVFVLLVLTVSLEGFYEFLLMEITYYLMIATFLSPFVVNLIPYYKKWLQTYPE